MIRTAFKTIVYLCGLWLNIVIALPVVLLSQDAWDQQWEDFNLWAKELWKM